MEAAFYAFRSCFLLIDPLSDPAVPVGPQQHDSMDTSEVAGGKQKKDRARHTSTKLPGHEVEVHHTMARGQRSTKQKKRKAAVTAKVCFIEA